MSSEKTEQPTPKKIRKAREEGQVAHSKDTTKTFLILALFGYTLVDAPAIVERLGRMMIYPAGLLGLEFGQAVDIALRQLGREAIALLLPFLLIVIGLGLFVEALQTGFNIAFKALKPSGKKLNVVTNAKNMFSKKNLVEFLKSNIKIVVLSVIVYIVLSNELATLLTLPRAGMLGVGVALAMLLKSMMVKIALGYAVIAIADFAWQRHAYRKEQRMTKDEVKREYKEAEGDPHIKYERRHLHQEMLNESRPEQRTRDASVVVTNPTHLAIALFYERDNTPLPLVLAKGEGALAERMMQVAREEGIPLMQNIPLARALMGTAEPGQYIPSDLVEAVAEVLRAVQGIKPKGQ